MGNYSVGLDIGISSVGWSIVDIDKKEIVDLGSRIFSSGDPEQNLKRRKSRGTRRLVRRRKNRLSDLRKILVKNEFPISKEHAINPYEIRVKGLSEQLTKEEISIAMTSIVKHRGISYGLEDSEDSKKSETEYKKSVNINKQKLKNCTVGQIQLERFEKYEQVRGEIRATDGSTLLNAFPTSEYVSEAKKILAKQKEFYPEITEEFVNAIVEKINRKREYYVGAGNEKSRTDYGIYKIDGRTLDNLFDDLIGIDELSGERRASASSLTAQIYNMLNDLNNLTVAKDQKLSTVDDNGKITTETKREILEKAKTSNIFGISQICKIIGCKKEEVKGFRIDSKRNPIIHNLSGYRKIRKELAKIGIEANDLSEEVFDKISDIITLNTDKAEIRKQLNKQELPITNEMKELVIEKNKNFLVTGNAKWHSFSYSTLKTLNKELMNTSDEQMTIITRLGMKKKDKDKYKGLTYVPAKKIAENIYNPVVAKSVREALKVFNALLKKYGRENIEYVIVELARETNEKEAKDNIEKFQKEQVKEKNSANELVKKQLGISDSALIAKYRKARGLAQKVRYWYQQEMICPYCDKEIQAQQLVNGNSTFEVDHIIPISVSYDDSQNNKVVVHSACNQAKGQQTPLGWLNKGGGFGQSKEDYIAKVNGNKHYSDAKKRNLLNNDDLGDIITQRGFVQRNINDTRYASRVVLNELQQFMKATKKQLIYQQKCKL